MPRLLPAEQERLKASRLRFVEGHPLPPRLLSDSVARSWERSRQAGLLPWAGPRHEPLPGARIPMQTDADRRLGRYLHGEIEPLWSAFGGPDWVLFCVNTRGVVVSSRQSAMGSDPAIRAVTVGKNLSETLIGTTAPSCALVDGAESIVEGNQHFLADFESLFCYSVPLRGMDGEVIGALDITGRGERDIELLRPHFRAASLSAEARMLASLRHCHQLRLQPDPRWLTTPLAGVIAVDDDGRVRAVSLLGRRMLGLPPMGSVRGVALGELLSGATPAQRRRFLVPAKTPQRIARADGSHVWLQYARAPMKRLPRDERDGGQGEEANDGTAVPVVPDWREQGMRAIAQVLHTHEGNVSAAARHLGMSRTTLYAKLSELRRTGLL